MPAGATQPRCWSCGLDPTGPVGADDPGRGAHLPASWHSALLVAAAATLVVVALVGTVLMLDPQEDGQGVRGIAARIHGAWLRADVAGATAEFPSRPVRSTVPFETGPTGTAEALVATAPGLRVELRATTVVEPLSPAVLLGAYGDATGQRVRRATVSPVSNGPGLDAVLDGPQGPTRARAIVTGSSAYVLSVAGPATAFERFTASFAITS